MAAYTQGGALWTLKVANAMSPKLYTCKGGNSVAEAEEIMRTNQVRRLPVVNEEGRLVGIVSLNDIASEAEPQRGRKKREVTFAEVGETLKAICRAREVASVAA